jgi:hypothetical protein
VAVTVEEFRAAALERFSFLEPAGFRRMATLEQSTPAGGTVVYLGHNVGFVISLDVRDQCVDAAVVSVRDGRLQWKWEGGYSSNLLTYLVEYRDFRGSRNKSDSSHEDGEDRTPLHQMLDGWVDLVKVSGLLDDRPDSLPQQGSLLDSVDDWRQEVEQAALSEFAILLHDGRYAGPMLERGRGSTRIGYLRSNVGLEVELDWTDGGVSVLLVRPTTDGGLPGGYYTSGGQRVRVRLVNWLWERGRFEKRESATVGPAGTIAERMMDSLRDLRSLVELNLADIESNGPGAFDSYAPRKTRR